MYAIGDLSRRTGVKVPTIRYYESVGLLPDAGRTAGNQRRYDQTGLSRLAFIKHARQLGFSIEAIGALIDLNDHPDRSCAEATSIAKAQLQDVRTKLAALTRLERELHRIADVCDGLHTAQTCDVLAALSDHSACGSDH